ncbi:MAG: hypothetical protein J5933_04515 [Clostridia bacterium]|nr:hypothetical protein [Clostridia bacterium]
MKNEYIVTWKKYLSWELDGLFDPRKSKKFIVLLSMGILYIIFGILITVLLINLKSSAFGVPILFFVLGLLSVYFSCFSTIVKARRNYGLCVKLYGTKPEKLEGRVWKHSIVFDTGRILFSGDESPMEYEYNNIDEVIEKEDDVKINFKSGESLHIYKSAFKEGDWSSLRKLLESLNDQIVFSA